MGTLIDIAIFLILCAIFFGVIMYIKTKFFSTKNGTSNKV